MSKLPPYLELSENFLKFYSWAADYLKSHNKKIDIRPVSYLRNQGKCSGYCDGQKIVIAGKCGYFEEVFTHEFGHCVQSINNSPLWKDNFYWDSKFRVKDFNSLLSLILLERDCDIKVINLSEKWGLFDNKLYSKQANAYLHLHHFIFLNKRYIDFPNLYHPDILNLMPDKIMPEHSVSTIDMNVMKIFDSLFRNGTGN